MLFIAKTWTQLSGDCNVVLITGPLSVLPSYMMNLHQISQTRLPLKDIAFRKRGGNGVGGRQAPSLQPQPAVPFSLVLPFVPSSILPFPTSFFKAVAFSYSSDKCKILDDQSAGSRWYIRKCACGRFEERRGSLQVWNLFVYPLTFGKHKTEAVFLSPNLPTNCSPVPSRWTTPKKSQMLLWERTKRSDIISVISAAPLET